MRIRFARLLLFLVLVTSTAGASTFYVATDGDDVTGDGSQALPWATIENAVESVPDECLIGRSRSLQR